MNYGPLLELLITKGASLIAKNKDGNTPLDVAHKGALKLYSTKLQPAISQKEEMEP